MVENDLLEAMNVLLVDDEADVLDTLVELLPMDHIVKASTFDEGKRFLETQNFDLAILDIMGVDGFRLLDIANEKKVMAIMLTAHALTPENTVKAYKKGAAYFLPKEKMVNIETFLKDIFESKSKGEDYWSRWLERLETYYDKRFGPHWKDSDREFWDKLAEQKWRLASVLRGEGEVE